MKRIITVLFAAGLMASVFTGCKEEYTTYSDAEYVMFADTTSLHAVVKDQAYFTVPVASTAACDYDRTFAVEIVDQGSNAMERYHYRLLSNQVTIKAGQCAAEVRIQGLYDNIKDTDSLGFKLRLVIPKQLEWKLYKDFTQTKVRMMKSCPFELKEFTGWCVVSSMFLYQYPGATNPTYQRLVWTSASQKAENTVILHSFLFDGYDVRIQLDPTIPERPLITMDKDQVISDEELVFGQIHGDNKILATHSSANPSYFNPCQKFAQLWTMVYLQNLGSTAGLPSNGMVGHFYNIINWVSQEEADRLEREEGMIKHGYIEE